MQKFLPLYIAPGSQRQQDLVWDVLRIVAAGSLLWHDTAMILAMTIAMFIARCNVYQRHAYGNFDAKLIQSVCYQITFVYKPTWLVCFLRVAAAN